MDRLLEVGSLTLRTFSSFISGQCLEALILGGAFFLCMTIFRFPYALLISVFISVTALIPVLGAWIGCITGALLILMVDPMQALLFVVMFIALQQLEGNLIYPHVMGNAIGLPSLWVLLAVVLGEGLLGIVGMLLFIPLTSVIYTLLRQHVNQRLREAGIGEAAIASVHTPIGTAIKAVTPEEIAVSITGEMILVRATRREARGEEHHGCPMH